ncbi:MAG: hypothetical protein FD129_2185, partial [bacterium]
FACALFVLAGPIVRAIVGLSGGGTWLDAYLLTPGRLDALALGGLLAGLYRAPEVVSRARLKNIAGWVAAATASGLMLLQLGHWLNGFTLPGVVLGLSLVAGLSAGGLALCIEAPATSPLARMAGSRFLRFFGRYSYGIYLLHQPIQYGLRKLMDPHNRHLTMSGISLFSWQLLFGVVALGVVTLAALVTWHLWEQPFLSLKRFVPRPQGPSGSNNPS